MSENFGVLAPFSILELDKTLEGDFERISSAKSFGLTFVILNIISLWLLMDFE